ncbi:MAG: Uma2 family endonuclease [Phycicoccus sp.]|nr:Uma2 family endonuclease [Phycicoccus sp.]
MEAMTYVLDDREWTREERDALPDDGSRYELIDGALVVTPAPPVRHQRMAGGLYRALYAACPPEWEVFFAPFDVDLDVRTSMQPDLVVVRRSALQLRGIAEAPLLAIEILSPSTAMIDRNLKFRKLQQSGCPSYWLVDPQEPALTAFELVDGRYEEVAHVIGDQTWTASAPYPLALTPNALMT